MAEIRRLAPDDRFEAALAYVGRRVRLRITSTTGSRSEHDGWVTSVATLLSGTSSHTLSLRTDQTRKDKDLGFSLALITTITPLGLDGQPSKENFDG